MLDHIVLAVPDLAAGVEQFTERTGVRPVPGGRHLGVGTANHLVGLDGCGDAYLEIIGPDPDQPAPPQPRPFGIDDLAAARVATWAVRPADLDRQVAEARARGYDPGAPRAMSRATPDGEGLHWRLTGLDPTAGEGLVPFLIDWGSTPHPASRGLPVVRLRSFEATLA